MEAIVYYRSITCFACITTTLILKPLCKLRTEHVVYYTSQVIDE